jgi:hypothetical protein
MGAAWESGMISSKQLRKYLASTSEDGDPQGVNMTFDVAGAGQGRRQPKQDLGMGRGHIDDPKNIRSRAPGLMAREGRGQADFGPSDVASRGHIDNKRNRSKRFPKGDSAIRGPSAPVSTSR